MSSRTTRLKCRLSHVVCCNRPSRIGGQVRAISTHEFVPVGFEVYVTPYSDKQITDAQFKTDEPSGIMNQLTHATIDGAPATMFYATIR
jgi:hypothetical protein